MKLLSVSCIALLTVSGCASLENLSSSFKRGYDTFVGSPVERYSAHRDVTYKDDGVQINSGNELSDLRENPWLRAFAPIDDLDRLMGLQSEPLPFLPPLKRTTRQEVYQEMIRLSHPDQVFGLKITMKRAESYIYQIAKILAQNGLSNDLAIVPFIESNYRADARSSQGAVGLWQFTTVTGKDNGLDISIFSDERKDPLLSTIAASKLLRDLYATFNDWPLALAAYNAGKPRIQLACKKYAHCNFWRLAKDGKIPKQTAAYVPKAIAMLMKMEQLNLWPFTKIQSV